MEVLDAGEVAGIGGLCQVVVDGKGVVMVICTISALDRTVDTRSREVDDVVPVAARGIARNDISGDGGSLADVHGVPLGGDAAAAIDVACDGDTVRDVDSVAE